MTQTLLAIALAGCAQLPATLRPATPDELDAIGVTLDEWANWRGPVRVPLLEIPLVAVVPHDELQEWCVATTHEVHGCVYSVQRWPGDPPHAAIYVSDALDYDTAIRVVIHESLHEIRATWALDVRDDWDGYSARLNEGERAGCSIYHPEDNNHCDTAVWSGVEPAAYRSWLELGR